MRKVLILGAAGFLGSHLEHRMKAEGHFVVSVARQPSPFRKSIANEFNILDLTNDASFHTHFFRHHDFDEVYQLAGEVGGLGYIANTDHDAEILTNSLRINMHTLEAIRNTGAADKIFFASSQCVYPDRIEVDPYAQERILVHWDSMHRETDAHFDTFAFGQEKLFAEKLYDAYARNYGINIRIGRIGNTYGPYCVWDGERAKAPAAICRKVAQAPYAGVVELWGDGQATRSFTYVDNTIEGMIRLMASDYNQPVNLAHSELYSIENLFETTCKVAGKVLAWKGIEGPIGVQARGSDNTLCRKVLGWEPEIPLLVGLGKTYPWIAEQVLTKQFA